MPSRPVFTLVLAAVPGDMSQATRQRRAAVEPLVADTSGRSPVEKGDPETTKSLLTCGFAVGDGGLEL